MRSVLVTLVLLAVAGLVVPALPALALSGKAGMTEGALTECSIVVGPFDIHRRYRSMEGPYVTKGIRIGDLVAAREIVLPESMVVFVEGGGSPSMMSAGSASTQPPDTSGEPRELLWFKGMKIEVLDEKDKLLKDAEFICHLNVDVNTAFRRQVFPEAQHTGNNRIITLTQGQTDFHFPDGFGVPVASDEIWTFTFQAANRTTDEHRRLKQRCTITLVRDKDLVYPIKALHWYNPYITVTVDKDTAEARELEHKGSPDCLGTVSGVTAPNSAPGSVFGDSTGRRLSGHWVIPPGTHSYNSPIVEERDPGFAARERRIHAVWTHVHPLCTETALLQCLGHERKKVFSVPVKTKTAGGLQLERIENILSKEGILLEPNKRYELQAIYENPTDTPQDSMVALGVFFADDSFARPDWRLANKNAAYCGIKLALSDSGCEIKDMTSDAKPVAKEAPASPGYPLFNVDTDGPLLSAKRQVEIETSFGKLHAVLDPALAPRHATQLYRLLKTGAFDGTPLYRYEPNFVLQTANAEAKADGQPQLSEEQRAMLRRLPLEVKSQVNGAIRHAKWALSMARYDEEDSAVSSFSILLGDAPHLDHKYTIFGQLIPDEVTAQTMSKILRDWSAANHPYILKARDL